MPPSVLQLQHDQGEVSVTSPGHSQRGTLRPTIMPFCHETAPGGEIEDSSRDQDSSLGTLEATGATPLKLSVWNPESVRKD